MSARTTQGEFLERVRQAMARGDRHEVAAPPVADLQALGREIARIRQEAAARREELQAQFKAELDALAGAVHTAGAAEVPALVAHLAGERKMTRVVGWDESGLGIPGLVQGLRARGLQVAEASARPDGDLTIEERAALHKVLAEADIGISGVDFAVAETGSLVLLSGPGKSRLVTTLPPLHIALVRRGDLVPTMASLAPFLTYLHRSSKEGFAGSCINFITGPSRTADIELTLTRGVHGPKELHAIFLEG